MDREYLLRLLVSVQNSQISPEEALESLRAFPYEDAGFAKIDHHRPLRTGMPEVIFAEGKPTYQVAEIFSRMANAGGNVLATRAGREHFEAVRVIESRARYNAVARTIALRQDDTIHGKGVIAIVCAGTSDLAIAEEARETAELLGNTTQMVTDVGVAGLHRLLAQRETLQRARVLIVCAGMEGALPSVVAGMVSAPVIAVPTSIGYGAAFEGLAALLGMLNSCAPNISVVNIDNGFGAGYLASVINKM